MRLSEPRIQPVADEAMTDRQRASIDPLRNRNGEVLNIFRTFVNSPEAMDAFMTWGSFILSDRNTVPMREREIAILRVGFLCCSGYEFTQHTRIGLRAGLSESEIDAIKQGPADPQWSDADRALLVAVDQLHGDQFVSDVAWAELLQHFDATQGLHLVCTVGQYTQVSMLLNTLGVQLDPGQVLDPQLDRRDAS